MQRRFSSDERENDALRNAERAGLCGRNNFAVCGNGGVATMTSYGRSPLSRAPLHRYLMSTRVAFVVTLRVYHRATYDWGP